ncbi:MAG: zinc ribbon domain-containing protein [Chloroflexi bacterium]|nr:zinc ribbon domain-containing protein [Chloroflexota bacterium]
MPFGFDIESLTNYALVGTALLGAFGAALWLSLVIWTYRDMRARSRDALAQILAALVVALLFLPGFVVYLILRPPETLAEAYQRSLEEEALLQGIEEKPLCPGCGRATQPDWMLCPNCHTRLRRPCSKCGRPLELQWNLCPHCGTPAPGRRERDEVERMKAEE